jgi:hypothetical protein
MQHQNPAEWRYQTVKAITNTILDRTGSPAYLWLLCLMYVCFLLNNTSSKALSGAVPIQVLTGSTNDISPLLQFRWYEPVYYLVDDSPYPSDPREKRGYFVGIAEHVGHAMTFKVLTDDTRKIIYRPNIRSASDPKTRNLRLDPINDEKASPIILSRHDSPAHGEGGSAESLHMPTFNPHDLIRRTLSKLLMILTLILGCNLNGYISSVLPMTVNMRRSFPILSSSILWSLRKMGREQLTF